MRQKTAQKCGKYTQMTKFLRFFAFLAHYIAVTQLNLISDPPDYLMGSEPGLMG